MKIQSLFYIFFITLLMTQYNNCSKANVSSSFITQATSLSDPNTSGEDGTGSTDVPPPPIENATLLYYQDFESNSDGIDLAEGSRLVDIDSYSGKVSLRGNLMPSKQDPITGKDGREELTKMNNIDLANSTPKEVYLRFWFKFDDALWMGDNFFDKTDSIKINAKLGYLSKSFSGFDDLEASFFPTLKGGEYGEVQVSDNLLNVGGGASVSGQWLGWELKSGAWVDDSNKPTKRLYGKTGKPFGADGKWHLFELHIKYNATKTHHLARIFIDEHVVYDSKNAPKEQGGYFVLPKEFHLDQFTLFSTEKLNTNLSEDRSGYACGVQVDEIQIWDALPEKYKK